MIDPLVWLFPLLAGAAAWLWLWLCGSPPPIDPGIEDPEVLLRHHYVVQEVTRYYDQSETTLYYIGQSRGRWGGCWGDATDTVCLPQLEARFMAREFNLMRSAFDRQVRHYRAVSVDDPTDAESRPSFSGRGAEHDAVADLRLMRAFGALIVLIAVLWVQRLGPVFAFVGGFGALIAVCYLLILASNTELWHDLAMRHARRMLRRTRVD